LLTAQFLDWFEMPIASWGIFEATRRRAEALAQSRKTAIRPSQLGPSGSMQWQAEQSTSQ
jgi:hypothetical protein